MEYEQEISLRDLFMLLRRGFLLAALVAVGAAGATYYLSKRITPEYSSTVTLLASRAASSPQGLGVSLVTAPPIDVGVYQAAAVSFPVVLNALERLGHDTVTLELVDEFKELVTVKTETASQSSLIRISVRDADPQTAALAANALGRAMLEWDEGRATQNLQAVIETLEGQIAALDSEMGAGSPEGLTTSQRQLMDGLLSLRGERVLQLNAARALRSSAVGLLEVLEPAQPSERPTTPRPLRNAALAFVLGIFLVYGLVLLRDALDTRFRNADDLVRTTDLAVLGEFPRIPTNSVVLPLDATSYLRTNVGFATASDHPKVLLVTSSTADEGKSTVAIGLAETFARNDYNVLLIDGDMRKPVSYKRLDLPVWDEVSMSLSARLKAPTKAAPVVATTLRGVTFDLIPGMAISSEPSELLSRGFSTLMAQLKPQYDVIVVDSPPVLPVADALSMAPHTSGVVLVVSASSVDRRSVLAAKELLNRVGVRILGTVLTNVENTRRRSNGYGYGYGYGYGHNAGEAEQPTKRARRQKARQEPTSIAEPERSATAQVTEASGYAPRDPARPWLK